MENKKDNGKVSVFEKIGASFRRKGFRSGVYATVTSVLVIVAVIVVNMIASASGIQKDLTVGGEKSLTEETKQLLDGLEDELTFYYLTRGGSSEDSYTPYYEMYMDLYEHASKKITFETVDLLLNPKFAEPYTNETVLRHSIIVVNEATQLGKYVSSEDMMLFETTMDMNTFQYKDVPVGLDIEGQLNAAIRYVTTGQQTCFYALSGHGEKQLGTEGQNQLRKANISYSLFESMTATTVPEDCDVLYITAPAKDYTAEELEMIKAYADKGGDFLILAESMPEMTNYNKLLAYCGVQVENRVILEGDSQYHHPASQLMLFPIIEKNHEITGGITGANYLPVQYAYTLSKVTEADREFEVSALVSTSEASYAKVVKNSMTSTKEKGDTEGPFRIALYLKNSDTASEAVVISSGYVFVDDCLSLSNYANGSLLTNSVNYLAGTEAVSSVRTLSFESADVLSINAAQANGIAIVMVVVIPVVLLVFGVFVMLRRRNR